MKLNNVLFNSHDGKSGSAKDLAIKKLNFTLSTSALALGKVYQRLKRLRLEPSFQ